MFIRIPSAIGCLLLSLVFSAGCGGSGSGVAVGPNADVAPPDTGAADVPARPDLPRIDFVLPGDTAAGEADGGADTDGAGKPLSQFGEPCSDNADCASGWCIETYSGSLCTDWCEGDCPEGYRCRPVMQTAPDVISICIPDTLRYCAACTDDRQCIGGGVCLTLDGEGRCTGLCDETSPCPTTFDCTPMALAGRADPVDVCVPQTGSCRCTAATNGQLRACWNENAYGTCYGFETCDATTGWTLCDARVPAAEDCNGIDDDCDGPADEDLPQDLTCEVVVPGVGTCTGRRFCRGSEGWQCDAGTPGAEVCDGADNDCDGEVDEDFKQDGRFTLDAHCGGCNFDCAGVVQNGTAQCAATEEPPRCEAVACDPGYYLVSGACLAYSALACLPCVTDADCEHPGNRCVPLDKGTVCVLDCGPENPFELPEDWCDAGYSCEPTVEGGKHCYPVSGSCSCLPADAGAERVCVQQNANGSCYGREVCEPTFGWSVCSAPAPAIEVCDRSDNDCNGQVDDLPEVGTRCTRETPGVGTCAGTLQCTDGGPELVCNAPVPAPDVCNFRDDDCDGQTDEDFPMLGTPCSAGIGACLRGGVYVCAPDGQSVTCTVEAGSPTPERCNGLDDDCDGDTDPEDAMACNSYYYNLDGDTYGDEAVAPRCLCSPEGEYRALQGGDCDDSDFAVHPAAIEACNALDDDCDGDTDEGVLSECGNCDPYCAIAEVGLDGDEPFTPTGDNSSGVAWDETTGLSLNTDNIHLTFIWIANSAESTISQLDTVTGWEVGRYRVCNDPSRTAVDLFGNMYAACRGDDAVVKIILDRNLCRDRNGNGIIETSTDLDGDHRITGAEILAYGTDECVAWVRQPLGADYDGIARGIAVDRHNRPWVGYWSPLPGGRGYTVMQLDPDTGAILREINGLNGGTYGIVIDHQGRMWVSCRNGGWLLRLDIESNPPVVHSYKPSGHGDGNNFYGIVVDKNDDVWVGNYSDYGVWRFRPTTETFQYFGTDRIPADRGYTRGLAASKDGSVIIAHSSARAAVTLANVNVDPPTFETIWLSDGARFDTVGAAFDYQGYGWAVNYSTSNATKIDVVNRTVIGSYPVGSNPYTYSDMTGYNLHVFTAPNGFYRHTVAGWPALGTRWLSLDVHADIPDATYLQVRLRSATTVAGLLQTQWSDFIGPFPPSAFPLDLSAISGLEGSYLDIEVWLFSTDQHLTPTVWSLSVTYTAAAN